MGLDHGYRHRNFMKKFATKAGLPNEEEVETILDKYVNDFKTYGDLLCQLTSIRFNLHCMSHHFVPFVQYLTPQCGERQAHQAILDGFAAIHKEYLKEYEDEEIDEEEFTEDESN